MNSIYITNTGKTQIAVQQGVIINGCLAENYACEVHGLIITPRSVKCSNFIVSSANLTVVERWYIDCCMIRRKQLQDNIILKFN